MLGGERVEDRELAVVARHIGMEAEDGGREHGAPDVGVAPVGQREPGIHGAVDAGGGQLGVGAGHPRARSQQAEEGDRVAAHVHGRSARQGQLVADVTLLPQGGRECDVDRLDVAELS